MKNKRNYIERAQESEGDISLYYPFFLSIRHLLSNIELPSLLMIEKIIESSERLGLWSVKNEVLNRMGDSEIRWDNFWDTLRIGLENGSDKIVDKCLRYLSKETLFQIDVKQNNFKNLNISLYPKDISLMKMHSEYLNPLFYSFEKYGEVQRKKHKIDLSVRFDTDPNFLGEFMKDFTDNIVEMSFICFDYLDEQFLNERCTATIRIAG